MKVLKDPFRTPLNMEEAPKGPERLAGGGARNERNHRNGRAILFPPRRGGRSDQSSTGRHQAQFAPDSGESKARPWAGSPCHPLSSRSLAVLALLAFTFAPAVIGSATAAPHVVGFERFHSEAPSIEGGALLYSELGCATCHGGSAVEVSRRGPRLDDLSRRVEYDWLLGFLQDPASGRKGSNMPGMLHGLSESDTADLLAYLGTLGEGARLNAGAHANAVRGLELYHEKGCIACHAPGEPATGAFGGGPLAISPLAVAHPDLAAKTSLAALADFLKETDRYRDDGRMPHFGLDAKEAVDIAAYLIDFEGSDPRDAGGVAPWPRPSRGAAGRGSVLAERLHCAACHTLPGGFSAQITPLAELSLSESEDCLSSTPVEGLPHYPLSEIQRESLRLFLESGGSAPEPEDLPRGHLTLAAMNCYACHDRDGVGGALVEANPYFHGDEGIGDSGRLPPPLTGIGHKLRRDWLQSVLQGSPEHRVRPYLKTEMPGYPRHATALTRWFERHDRPEEIVPLAETPDEDLEAGRKLLGVHGGTNCITCHTWGERPSLGIQALDIASLDRRLRPEWFRSYLLDPASYRAGTLMPPLWPGGQSMVPDVLEGDAERQIAAIWAFIARGEGPPEGFPDHAADAFELLPEDRPILQRTFFEGAGSRAILVGFPGGVHLAYDGEAGRPALAWRGRFFDAYNTWFTRSAPFESPLGEDIRAFETEGTAAGRFRGYRLDPEGNPTFIVRLDDGREIEESYDVVEGRLVRRVVWGEGDAPVLGHPEGVEIETEPGEGGTTYRYEWK